MSRHEVEHLLDALGWGWSASVSAMLDEAVLAEETDEEGRTL